MCMVNSYYHIGTIIYPRHTVKGQAFHRLVTSTLCTFLSPQTALCCQKDGMTTKWTPEDAIL